jgi:hypothetical protein
LPVVDRLAFAAAGVSFAAGLAGAAGVLWALAAGLVAVAYAGYGLHVRWLGINGRTATLWEWLGLVLMPIAFAAVPVAHRLGGRVRAPRPAPLLAGLLAIGVFITAAYLLPIRWMGFP